MLTNNLDISDGLMNGTMGKLCTWMSKKTTHFAKRNNPKAGNSGKDGLL